MYPKLFTLYGPLEVNSFNAALLVGLLVFFLAALRHTGLEKLISKTYFFSLCIESALAGILGARLLHIISEWNRYQSVWEMLSIWNGGLSIFGTFIAVLLYTLWVLRRKQLPILALRAIATP